MQKLTPQQRIAVAEAEIAEVQHEESIQTRRQQIQQLRDYTTELEEREVELVHVEAAIKLENEQTILFNRRIVSLQAAIGQSLDRKPPEAQWLSSSESKVVAAWEQRHRELEATLTEVLRQRDAAITVDRVAARVFAERVQYLRQARTNLMNALGGSLGRLSEGGIHSVA